MSFGSIKKYLGPDDIGSYEYGGVFDAAVNVGLGGKVNDIVRGGRYLIDQFGIGNIASDKCVIGFVGNIF